MKTKITKKSYAVPSVNLMLISNEVSLLASGNYSAGVEDMVVEEDVDW